jgi:hypothetical protein
MHLHLFIINVLTFLEIYQSSNKGFINVLSKVQRRWCLHEISTGSVRQDDA